MIIVEFTMDHPVLREPLKRVPDIEVHWEQSYDHGDRPAQMIAWVESDDFEAFHAAIIDDPGVTDSTLLAAVDERRLYRFDVSGHGRRTSLLPKIVESGGVLRRAVGTNDGWRCRVRMPDRAAFERVYQFCRTNDIGFEFHRLYEQSDPGSEARPSLTDVQRETLIEAVDSGYLDIPRACSLAELGERLGVSETATSERFRRAAKRLVQQTISR